MTSASSMHEAEHPKLVLWDNPEGWGGEGAGWGFRMGDTCASLADSCDVWQKPPQYCKVVSLQLKSINLKKEQVCITMSGGKWDLAMRMKMANFAAGTSPPSSTLAAEREAYMRRSIRWRRTLCSPLRRQPGRRRSLPWRARSVRQLGGGVDPHA